MAGGKPPRKVIEEAGFREGREAITQDARRWDDFWEAVEWALAQDPAAFDRVPSHDLWVIVSEPSRTGMPRVRVFYAFDDECIYLRWVEPTDF